MTRAAAESKWSLRAYFHFDSLHKTNGNFIIILLFAAWTREHDHWGDINKPSWLKQWMDGGCGSSQRGKTMKPELNCRVPWYYLDHIVVVVVVLLLAAAAFCHYRSDQTRPDHLLMHNLTRHRNRCDRVFVWKSFGMRTYAISFVHQYLFGKQVEVV